MRESDVNRQGASRVFSREQRLVRSSHFRQAYAQGRRFSGRLMTLWLRADPDACIRLGVVAGMKVGKAVQRNRAKRRLRGAFRANRHAFEGAFDVVLVARRAVLDAEWHEIENELLTLAQKAGLLQQKGRA